MWSVGCVVAELLTMKPLFPGKAEIDQINRIFKVVHFFLSYINLHLFSISKVRNRMFIIYHYLFIYISKSLCVWHRCGCAPARARMCVCACVVPACARACARVRVRARVKW